MTQTLSPRDTGEIEIGAAHPDERTQNLAPYASMLPPTLRRSDAATEVFDRIPATIGIVNFDGPQSPPPPLPQPPKYADGGVIQPLFPLERVAGAADPQVQLLRRSVPYVPPAELRQPGGRHRKPSTLDRLVAWVNALLGGAR